MENQLLYETVKTDLKSALIIFDKYNKVIFSNDRAEIILDKIEKSPEEFKELLLRYEVQDEFNRKEINIKDYLLGFSLERIIKEDKLDRTVIIFQDITSIKIKEKEINKKEQMEVLGQLALYIAHEVKNSLNLIKGYSQLMLESNSIKYLHKNLSIFLDETERLNKLTHNILDYTKDGVVDYEKVDMCKFTREFLKKSSDFKDINLNCNEDEIFVFVDRDKFIQLYMNIIQNGIDAIEKDGEFNIYIHKGANGVEVTFETDGKVEDAFELEKLFNPYYTTKKDGNGLGLAICKKIMKEHNGDICVEKNTMGGLNFVLKIPHLVLN